MKIKATYKFEQGARVICSRYLIATQHIRRSRQERLVPGLYAIDVAINDNYCVIIFRRD